jgi:hypothetical protein
LAKFLPDQLKRREAQSVPYLIPYIDPNALFKIWRGIEKMARNQDDGKESRRWRGIEKMVRNREDGKESRRWQGIEKRFLANGKDSRRRRGYEQDEVKGEV